MDTHLLPPVTTTHITNPSAAATTPTDISSPTSAITAPTDTSSPKKNNIAIISGSVIGATVFVIALVVILILYVKKSHKKNDTEFIIIDNEQIKLYKYNDFTNLENIGSGGYSEVYKAIYGDSTTFALKSYKCSATNMKEFTNEVRCNLFLVVNEKKNFYWQ